jgi:eukaryotic-like serine/threonine-protein kinase
MRPGRPLPESLAQRGPTLVAIGVAVFILFGWLYFALLESSVWRGTFGKHVLELYVADERGHPIDFWQATKRFLFGRLLLHVPIVGACYFLADCLCIALLSPQRAIHDILARCLVLKENHRS